jgi:hypothetical protein
MKTLSFESNGLNPRTAAESGSPPAAAADMFRHVRISLRPWLLLAAVLAAPGLLSAQTYSIDWYKVSGGGGSSTNGQFSMSGTIGQPDASSAMTGGNYSLAGGFWSLYAVQTPGAPALCIRQSGSAVTVFWQNVSGWNLQQNNSLTVPAGWAGSSGITTSNGTNYLNVTSSAGNLFFRLSNQ